MFGGGTLNAPLINYYEHGTFLTLNHAHTALFGAFGLLAIGLVYFCLRYLAAERIAFSERLGLWAFWLYNAGLVHVDCAELLSRSDGRSSKQCSSTDWPMLAVSNSTHGTLFWQWMRLPGDVVFAIAALLMAWDFLLKLGPLYPGLVEWITRRPVMPLEPHPGE